MNTKNSPSVYDGHSKALPDEPTFTLLGRDPLTPFLIFLWTVHRRKQLEEAGQMNLQEEAQITEAMAIRQASLIYLSSIGKSTRPYPSMTSAYEDVREFHKKFGLEDPNTPTWLTFEEMQFRVKFMMEELQEFQDAVTAKDMVKAADSLVDLAYVVLGTSARMGLPHDDIHTLVHMANMRKERAQSSEQSKRGSTLDVIKPVDWHGPENDIRDLLDLMSAPEE